MVKGLEKNAVALVETSNVLAGKYLSFSVGVEEYGIPIRKVIEILSMMDITHIPHTPEFVKGVINLRGRIIPVLDLRLKFGLEALPYNERTCIIVVDVDTTKGKTLMSVAVDFVSEVIDVSSDEISEAPDFGSTVNTDYILGIAKIQNKIKILLSIEKVIGDSGVVEIVENFELMDVEN